MIPDLRDEVSQLRAIKHALKLVADRLDDLNADSHPIIATLIEQLDDAVSSLDSAVEEAVQEEEAAAEEDEEDELEDEDEGEEE